MIKEEIKAAYLNRDFERAQLLMAEWCKQVAIEMKTASSKRELRQKYDEAHAFIQENIYLVRVVRAQIATELQSNSASFLYRDADSERHRWRISA
jgi:hypothetical protein